MTVNKTPSMEMVQLISSFKVHRIEDYVPTHNNNIQVKLRKYKHYFSNNLVNVKNEKNIIAKQKAK